MKILHISDTHGSHRRLRDLPEADVVVHSGDFTMNGSEQEALDFLNWFCDLPYLQKIFICGNHDECLYGDDNVHYLCNSGVEIGGVRFYGVPMFMGDCVTGRQAKHYANISLGAYLLGTTKLTIGTYSSIIKSFEIEFEGYDGLRGLDRDRLLLLLSHNMLPFCEENTNLLKETDIYADYLIKYNKQLLENLSASYISDCEVAYKILSSEVFTYEQKKRIISITPKDILIELDKLANQVLDIIINTDLKNIEEETIIEVLENASNESYRVYIISLLILEYDYDDNKIAELLSLLGGKYIDIAERSKHPVLEETKWNIKLSGALKHKRFISSAKEDKDGIRIYPKR